MCCTHAKFALPEGGTPNFQRTSDSSRDQSLMLNGGFAMMKSAFRSLCRSLRKVSAASGPMSASIPRMARFMIARRRVV